jgi:archaellum component FlaC
MSAKTKIERIRMLQALHSAMADIENDAIDSSSEDEEGGDGTTANPQQDNRIRHLTKEIAILELEIAKTTNDMNLEEKTMHECDEEMEGLAEILMRLKPIMDFEPKCDDFSRVWNPNVGKTTISNYIQNYEKQYPSNVPEYPMLKKRYMLFHSSGFKRVIERIKKSANEEMTEAMDNLEHFNTAYEKSKKSYDVLVEKVAELKKTIETKKLLILQASKKK